MVLGFEDDYVIEPSNVHFDEDDGDLSLAMTGPSHYDAVVSPEVAKCLYPKAVWVLAVDVVPPSYYAEVMAPPPLSVPLGGVAFATLSPLSPTPSSAFLDGALRPVKGMEEVQKEAKDAMQSEWGQ